MKVVEETSHYVILVANEHYGEDYYVYGAGMKGDPRVVPSLSMAQSIAARLSEDEPEGPEDDPTPEF